MRKIFKWVGIVVVVLVVLLVVVVAVLYVVGNNALNETYDDITVEAVTVPDDADAIARGQHLAEAVSLCAECHGDDLSGKEFIDEAIFGSGDAPNLTAGTGGIGAEYAVEDWVRAVRHGVKPNGDAITFMPSHYYNYMGDDDLGALIAYIQSVPPVDRESSDLSLGIIGTIVGGILMDLPADEIDHDAARPDAPEAGVTVEYGAYLVNIAACKECHAKNLDGDVPPGAPAGPDLTPGGDLGGWSEQDFINTMRQGITPTGNTLDHEEMPWDYYTRMTDAELQAIWAYLQTLEG